MNKDYLNRIAALSPEQQALLQRRLKQKGLTTLNLQGIPQRKPTDEVPLSFIQERLWFLHQLQPDIPLYNESIFLRLTGYLNPIVLEKSLNTIIQRHEILRTNFQLQDNQPIQIIRPELTLTLPVIDLQALPETEQETKVEQLVTEYSSQPFNLSQGLLLRGLLLQLKPKEHRLLLTLHHIIYDGWSWQVLFQELISLYQAFSQGNPSPLPELPIQYADFALWQRQGLKDEVRLAQLNYWKERLANVPSILNLPTDYPRPAIGRFRGARKLLSLPNSLTQSLKALSRQEGVTLFMLLLAAFKTLLHRYSRETDILVGTPIAHRSPAETEKLIGCFLNTLVLRTNLSGNPSFRELLARVREGTLSDYTQQDLPFEQLIQELHPERVLSHTPLFQVMFVFQENPLSTVTLSDLTITPLMIDSGISKFDLTVFLEDTPEGLIGAIEYNSDLFKDETIARMLGHFQTLLTSITVQPEQNISTLPLLTEAQQYQQLVQWNNTQADYPLDTCVHRLFELQVEKTADAVAVAFEDKQLTYRELNQRANQLAHYLQKLGVKPEVKVGICVERSLEMVIGLLGILKAGGVYMPLDPVYPQQRLSFMVQDAQISVLLTQQSLSAILPEHHAQVIYLDTDWDAICQESQENPHTELTTNHLAYIIYTSGSTGQPKGVQIPHRALVNFLTAMRLSLGVTKQDTWLSATTITFDIAALEIYLPLIVGARLVVVSREVATDGIQLLAVLNNSSATVMQATPATWKLLLAAQWQGSPLLKILCGGEAFSKSLADELLQQGATLWNLYGPTETTIWSTTSQIHLEDEVISIGRPIANTQVYILDQHLQPVPIGVPGELYIGGAGLARAYLNRPELTTEKFIVNPFEKAGGRRQEAEGSKLYKTGDLARYLPDGRIEHLGRIDYQVKLRGFRIELGEIEATLSQHLAVQESAVMIREDEADDRRIVAYIVPKSAQKPTITELNSFLQQKLPSAMIPSTFVFLEALPLMPNGKINRKVLPAPEGIRPELAVTYIMPRTEVERAIASLWQKVLKVDQIGVEDNFFDLGGHSLLIVQIHNQIQENFSIKFPLMEMFKYPTINTLGGFLEKLQKNDSISEKKEDRFDKIKEGKNRLNQSFSKRKAMNY